MDTQVFITREGEIIQAPLTQGSAGLVRAFHEGSRTRAPSDKLFMIEAAQRARTIYGQDVRSDTADNFIADLEAIGFLRRLA